MAAPPVQLRCGERVRLTCAGQTVEAEVVVASGDGGSLVLQFEALLAGWAGYMPVLWTVGGWEALNGAPVTLARPL